MPDIIAKARQVSVDETRRDRRFVRLDYSAYPDNFDAADGAVGPIDTALGADWIIKKTLADRLRIRRTYRRE